VFANETVTLNGGDTVIVKTGIKVAIPIGYEIQIRPRSGLSYKTGLRVANAPGTIDSDYRGEVGVIMYNTSDENITIFKGDKIAQMVLSEVPMIKWNEVESLDETERGEGGFGSTGV
jgi:dUTP pyrophosphatase